MSGREPTAGSATIADPDSEARGRAEAVALLERMGVLPAGAAVSVEPLPGGVSSDIWLIRRDDDQVVLKRPRGRLKVAADWQAPIDRGASEAAWLEYVAAAVPGACPRVLGYDAASFAIALDYLDPARHRNWKSELLGGNVDAGFAGAVGAQLGRIHAASARTPGLDAEFDHQDLFESLRIEPYLLRAAAAVPAARERLEAVAASLREKRLALVHGDGSPKNILVGERPVFLDAECATWSDPAFDAAFCLTHLNLKRLHLPGHAHALRAAADAFEAAYLAEVDWEDAKDAAARIARILPALLLARVAGASPAEYLDEPARARVGSIALEALLTGRPVQDLIDDPSPLEGAAHG